MPPTTQQQVMDEIRNYAVQIREDRERMEQDGKTREEALRQLVAENTTKMQGLVDEFYAFKKQFVGPGAPITEAQGRAATQAGGIFEGRFKLNYRSMMRLSEKHRSLLPRDVERLRAIHDLNDAVVFRYHFEVYRDPQRSRSEIMNEIVKTIDFRMFVAQLQAAGYIEHGLDYQRAANEIINPQADVGAYLDFTLLSSTMIDLTRIASRVMSLFPTVQLTRAKMDYPALRADTQSVLGGGLTTYGIPTSDSTLPGTYPQQTMLQKPSYGEVSFDCIHNVGAIAWTDDMAEDSVVPFLPQMQEQGSIMIARGRDDAAINGDTAGSHQDSDVTAAYDIRKAWDGLRKHATANMVAIGAAPTPPDVNTLTGKLGKWAQNLGELALIVNIQEFVKMAADDDVKLASSIGESRATINTGFIGTVFGVEIVVSEKVRRDLDATGFYAAASSKTIEILVNRTRWWHGVRHDARVEIVRVPQALGQWLQVDVREDFQPIDCNAGATFDASFISANGGAPVAVGYNVTT